MSSMESSYLPSDIIYEIFSRASNDTLARCALVSKEWNQMAHESRFNKVHSQLNNIVDGFLVLHFVRNKYHYFFTSINTETLKIALDFLPRFSLEAIYANRGIILCKSNNRVPRFFVWKPRIKLFQQIPNPKTKFPTLRMVISVIRSNPFRYKILRISFSKKYVKNYQTLNCEVFDSETWTWKRLKDIVLPNDFMFMGWDPGVRVYKAFHWLMHPNLVFSFDVEEEEWEIHGLPIKKDDYKYIKLVEYEGKLALICVDSEGYMHTWVMENYKNQVWKKKFAIHMEDTDSDHRTYTPWHSTAQIS